MPGRTAELSVLDISEYYGPTSGGVRTYLHEKGCYVAMCAPISTKRAATWRPGRA